MRIILNSSIAQHNPCSAEDGFRIFIQGIHKITQLLAILLFITCNITKEGTTNFCSTSKTTIICKVRWLATNVYKLFTYYIYLFHSDCN